MGLTRRELGKLIGVRGDSVYKWEHGIKKPLKKNLEKIKDVLGLI